ncbi:MRG-domain-containing protein, partial [Auriscalpium vulgare]
WDEWVPPPRLLKFNEANIALQKSLHQTQAASTSASASASKTSTSAKGTGAAGRRKEGGRGTKRARDEDDGARRPDMRLQVPEALKVLLVDDWEAVTKNNMLVTLPREPNVVEILQEVKDEVCPGVEEYMTALERFHRRTSVVSYTGIVASAQTSRSMMDVSSIQCIAREALQRGDIVEPIPRKRRNDVCRKRTQVDRSGPIGTWAKILLPIQSAEFVTESTGELAEDPIESADNFE